MEEQRRNFTVLAWPGLFSVSPHTESLEPTKRPLVHVFCILQLHTPLDGPIKAAHRAWILSSSGPQTGDGIFSREPAARIGADEGRKRGNKTIR